MSVAASREKSSFFSDVEMGNLAHKSLKQKQFGAESRKRLAHPMMGIAQNSQAVLWN